MELAIMEANERKYKQSFHTPFMQPPLVVPFGYQGIGDAAQLVLDKEYVVPEGVDEFTAKLIQHLYTPTQIRDTPPHPTTIPVSSYRKYWRKAREHTSCYPSEISFATLKAGAENDLIAEFECIMTRIPVQKGYSPRRWRKCVDVMILKKAGLTQVDTLRTIVLFQADCNYAFKYIGREMMHNAEKHGLIAKEQYGSRKNHCSSDHALNKVLSNDLLRQLKQSGAICSNDAKTCYDLIGHTPASLSMQRLGVPQSFVVCMLETLQNMDHQVRTAYGDSDLAYGGSAQIIPMHGIGQGNGAGPAIWVAISTPLLNLLRSEGLGCKFTSPISKKEISFVGYAFVDDTDLIQTSNTLQSTDELITEMQRSLNTWEGGLRATGGTIVPEKSHWYLVEFHWNSGNWTYKSNRDAPGNLTVRDISGTTKVLKRLEPSEAATTLGVDIALDGNWSQQIKKMRAQSELWADQIRTGKLRRDEAWTALNSTLWKTLQYPLEATALTETECETIMCPAINQILPAMGIC
jgi:hypothetical protein